MEVRSSEGESEKERDEEESVCDLCGMIRKSVCKNLYRGIIASKVSNRKITTSRNVISSV